MTLQSVSCCGLGVVLHEGGADEGCDDAPALADGMRQHVAHEVHAAALPRGIEQLGDRSLDATLVSAAIEGGLPRGIGVANLRDAPLEWSQQLAMLSLSA